MKIGTLHGAIRPAFVPVEQRLELCVEGAIEAREEAGLLVLVVAFLVVHVDELGAVERHHGHGEEVRREDGEDYAERERREDVLADAVEEGDGEEHDGGGEGGGQHRHRHFFAALLRGNVGALAFFHVAEDVFEHDDAVVDEAREHQRQSAENHGVDGAAHVVVDREADDHRKRNREQHSHRCARAAEEDQDHHAGEHEADAGFADHVADGELDEDGLVEDHVGLEGRRECRRAF